MLIDAINIKAKELRDIRRQLNFLCSGLSGTAVTVPKKALPPLHYHIGSKLLISNARYNVDKHAVLASIKLPYMNTHKDREVRHDGEVIEVTIDRAWYPEVKKRAEIIKEQEKTK